MVTVYHDAVITNHEHEVIAKFTEIDAELFLHVHTNLRNANHTAWRTTSKREE